MFLGEKNEDDEHDGMHYMVRWSAGGRTVVEKAEETSEDVRTVVEKTEETWRRLVWVAEVPVLVVAERLATVVVGMEVGVRSEGEREREERIGEEASIECTMWVC